MNKYLRFFLEAAAEAQQQEDPNAEEQEEVDPEAELNVNKEKIRTLKELRLLVEKLHTMKTILERKNSNIYAQVVSDINDALDHLYTVIEHYDAYALEMTDIIEGFDTFIKQTASQLISITNNYMKNNQEAQNDN